MPIPLRTRLTWSFVEVLERRGIDELTEEQVPAARERRARGGRRRVAWPVVGRPHPGAPGQDVVLPTPEVALPARIYRPVGGDGARPLGVQAALPVVGNYHGGGFVFGDARQSEWLCSHVSAAAQVLVVSVDYRLAPEHPFPAAVDDAYRGLCWVAAHAADLGGDPTRLSVMGDSAGGNLAAVAALMARDRGGPPVAAQVLVYPATEMVRTLPSETALPRAPVLSTAQMHAFARYYLQGVDGTQPYASPLRADLAGLPPALIQTAQYDPLKDQGAAYARRLAEAGVPVRLTEYLDAVHGFASLPGISPCARQAVWEVAAFLRAHPPPPECAL